MKPIYYVYALLRVDETPFYIGMGRGNRWLDHESRVKSGRSHKDNIIAQMRSGGLTVPKVKLAENLDRSQACEIERDLIALLGRAPAGLLVNQTSGGEGALLTAGFRPSQARSSEALKGCVAALLGLSFIDTFDVWDIVLQEMFGASMAHMTHTEQLRLLRDIHRVTVEHAPASDDLVRAAREVVAALKAARYSGEVWDRVKNAIGALEDLIGPEPAVTDAQNQRSSE